MFLFSSHASDMTKFSHFQLCCFSTFFQRIKGNQIQKQLREEMDVLSDHVTSLNAHRETQTQFVRKLEEREKALQNAMVRVMIKSLKRLCPENTLFSRLNAPGVYLKIGSFDPPFFQGRRLIGVRHLIEKIRHCCFWSILPVRKS